VKFEEYLLEVKWLLLAQKAWLAYSFRNFATFSALGIISRNSNF